MFYLGADLQKIIDLVVRAEVQARFTVPVCHERTVTQKEVSCAQDLRLSMSQEKVAKTQFTFLCFQGPFTKPNAQGIERNKCKSIFVLMRTNRRENNPYHRNLSQMKV
jgi:hypothetical protein